MEIEQVKSEIDITGDVARLLRKRAKLSQTAFWGTVGMSQSGGCCCERAGAVPEPARILIYTIYVAGLHIDASTPEGIAHLARLAELQAAAEQGKAGRRKKAS